MEITNASPEWSSEDTLIFRQFLESPVGRRLIPALVEKVPGLKDGGDLNAILIRSGEVRGFQASVRELLELAYPPPGPTPVREEYPNLEDDSKWSTEQKTQ